MAGGEETKQSAAAEEERLLTIKANKERLNRFTNGLQNKSKVDTDEICRIVRGKN